MRVIRLLVPLIPPYAVAVAAKNAAYDHGWLRPKHLARPVVSVGNLSVGGAGKTPLVIRLAQLLISAGIAVDVLSRGYGRSGAGVERVDPDGDAARYGDEPLLIARAAGVPVYVGASRYEAGLRAERELPDVRLHLLDDGFQHRKLACAMDIVVLHAGDFHARLLPAGRLREPLNSLHRASVIVLRAEDREMEAALRKRGIHAPVWIQHRELAVEPGAPAMVFCGIARPAEFFSALHARGVELTGNFMLRDHQAYTQADVEIIISTLRYSRAERFLTTEKDWTRMTAAQRAELEAVAPLHVARLDVSLEDESAVLGRLRDLVVRK